MLGHLLHGLAVCDLAVSFVDGGIWSVQLCNCKKRKVGWVGVGECRWGCRWPGRAGRPNLFICPPVGPQLDLLHSRLTAAWTFRSCCHGALRLGDADAHLWTVIVKKRE